VQPLTGAGEKAVEYFCDGYNCAQSTASAFAEGVGLDPETVLNMMAGFGGGVGGTREMCGAVTGMVFVLGLSHGTYDPHDNEAKTALYKNVREAIEEFKTKFGSTCCRELLVKAGCLPKPEPSVRNAEYYAKRPCAHFVHEAAEIAAHRKGKK
jgi:C_GCAxxG_C_C family probable redox protein